MQRESIDRYRRNSVPSVDERSVVASFSTTVSVPASPDDAFAYLADFRNAKDWDPSVASVELVGDAPIAAGSEFDLVISFYARQIELRHQVEQFVDGERLVLAASSRRSNARDAFVITPTPTGCDITYDAQFGFGGFLKIFDRGLQVAFEATGKRAADGIVRALSTEM